MCPHLKESVEVITDVLHKVHVTQLLQHQVSGLIGERNLKLKSPYLYKAVARPWLQVTMPNGKDMHARNQDA